MNLYFSDTTDRPGSREMTSISPEYILETKPKVIVEEINTGSSLMSGTVQTQTQYNTNPDQQQYKPRPTACWACLPNMGTDFKMFSCSTQLSLNFILPLNVTMPTIVGILTIMSRMNISEFECTKIFFIFQHFSFI